MVTKNRSPQGIQVISVLADGVEAGGQHVDQKPANELVRVERHRLVAGGSVDPIVLDLKRHRLGISRDQTPVRDRHAMRVARQVGEHRLGPGQRALGVDVPARPFQRRQIGGEQSGCSC